MTYEKFDKLLDKMIIVILSFLIIVLLIATGVMSSEGRKLIRELDYCKQQLHETKKLRSEKQVILVHAPGIKHIKIEDKDYLQVTMEIPEDCKEIVSLSLQYVAGDLEVKVFEQPEGFLKTGE